MNLEVVKYSPRGHEFYIGNFGEDAQAATKAAREAYESLPDPAFWTVMYFDLDSDMPQGQLYFEGEEIPSDD